MPKTGLMQTRYLTEEDKQALIRRISRAGGQIQALRTSIERADCVDALLIQISAAKAALTQVALELMEKHLVNCTDTCMGGERADVIRRVTRAVAAVVRNG